MIGRGCAAPEPGLVEAREIDDIADGKGVFRARAGKGNHAGVS